MVVDTDIIRRTSSALWTEFKSHIFRSKNKRRFILDYREFQIFNRGRFALTQNYREWKSDTHNRLPPYHLFDLAFAKDVEHLYVENVYIDTRRHHLKQDPGHWTLAHPFEELRTAFPKLKSIASSNAMVMVNWTNWDIDFKGNTCQAFTVVPHGRIVSSERSSFLQLPKLTGSLSLMYKWRQVSYRKQWLSELKNDLKRHDKLNPFGKDYKAAKLEELSQVADSILTYLKTKASTGVQARAQFRQKLQNQILDCIVDFIRPSYAPWDQYPDGRFHTTLPDADDLIGLLDGTGQKFCVRQPYGRKMKRVYKISHSSQPGGAPKWEYFRKITQEVLKSHEPRPRPRPSKKQRKSPVAQKQKNNGVGEIQTP